MMRALPLVAVLLPAPALAHPHVFIDTGLTLVLNAEGQLAEIRVTWAYDELYSLLVMEEYGVDDDYDGVLRPEEIVTLNGFDMNWVPGFEGDSYLQSGGMPVALSGPLDPSTVVEDGRVVTTHTRRLETPLDIVAPVSVKAYDPTFYTAYSVSRGVTVEGNAGCTATVAPANLDAAYTLLEELLYGPRSAEFDEENFPEVGEAFADEVRLTCASGS
jgi:ABC-type uncharacterized transport system substrate-binding protein